MIDWKVLFNNYFKAHFDVIMIFCSAPETNERIKLTYIIKGIVFWTMSSKHSAIEHRLQQVAFEAEYLKYYDNYHK